MKYAILCNETSYVTSLMAINESENEIDKFGDHLALLETLEDSNYVRS